MTKCLKISRNNIVIAILLFSLIFSSCSLQMTYNYMDWILPWYLDDYVTLTEQQENFFDSATYKLLGWHRSEELPRYAAFLSTLKEAQTSPMNQQQVLFFFDEATDLLMASLAKSMPDLLTLAIQLSDKQIQQIDRTLKADIVELQEKYGDKNEEEQRRFWQTKLSESLSDWVGNITGSQQQLIKHWSEIRINTTEDWLLYRCDWRGIFIELLNQRNQGSFVKEMQDFLLQPQQTYTIAYLQAVSENRLNLAQLIADLSSTLTIGQRTYFQEKLEGIIIDMRELSEQEN